MAAALAALLLIGGVAYWGYSTNLERLPRKLIAQGVRAEAELLRTGDWTFVAGNRVVAGQPIGPDVERLDALNLAEASVIPVLFSADAPRRFIVDWASALAPIRDSARTTGGTLAEAVTRRLEAALPARAGQPACALRAADRIGGFDGQLSLVDGYAANEPRERERWGARFREPAYASRLRQVCR